MPNWKKVIVSGSDAVLNNITATGNITASGNISSSGALIANELTASGLKYPSTDGTSGQVLTTDGSGNLAFTTTTTAITASAISASYIDLDVTADQNAPDYKEGRLYYNAEDGALTVYNDEADVSLQVGQEFWVRAKNNSGVDILNGTPVYISGSQGDRPAIWAATAHDHISEPYEFENHIIGVATHDILDTEEGYVTAQGIVRGVDTTIFTAGATLFLQTGSPATPEDYYRTDPPPYPYDTIRVGWATKIAANGFIFVEPKSAAHLFDIADISGSAYNAAVGDILVKKSNGGFTYSKTLSGSYTIEGSGSTLFEVVGSEGQLFSITDSLSGSLFAVSDVSGIPILEVFSDDTVKIGSFNNEAIVVSGSTATVSGSFSGSFEGDGSGLTGVPTASYVENAVTASIAEKVELSDWVSGGSLDLVVGSTTNNLLYTVAADELTYNFSTNTLSVPNLAGTASWATNAITASYAENATSWDGIFTGSAEITGSLTVVGDISASGNIILDDTITFTGETSTIGTNWSGGEGDISIRPDGQLYLGDQSTNNVLIGRTNNSSYTTIIYGGDTTENLKTSLGSVELNVPVTASSDISASGQFIGANFGLDSTDKLQFSTETLQIRLGDASKYTIGPTIFRPTDDEGASLGRSADKWKELVVNHITASGNISASGTLTANNIVTNGITTNGDLTVTGKVTAQEFHTEFVSSSIIYESGSTKFGDTSDDTHEFTGSVDITGSLNVRDNNILITSGNIRIDTFGEGIQWNNGSGTYGLNEIRLSSAQNMQLVCGGVFQFYRNMQLLSGQTFRWNNPDNSDYIYINNSAASGLSRLDISDSSDNELMVISSSGNVGIGTASPSQKLHVEGGDALIKNATSTNTFLDVKGTSANAYIRAYSDSNSVWLYQGGNSSYLQAQNGSTLRVGSGTGNLIFTDTSGEVIRTDSGNVGIGTTSPATKLHVSGGAAWFAGNSNPVGNESVVIQLGLKDGDVDNPLVKVYTDDVGEDTLEFYTGRFLSTTKFTHTSASTSDRINSVDIKGDYLNGGSIQLYRAGGTAGIGTQISSDQDSFFNGDGNVGIGTASPQAKLHLNAGSNDGLLLENGNAILGNTGTGYTELLYWSNGNAYYGRQTNSVPGGVGDGVDSHIFRTGGQSRLTIDSSGNIGIGTTSPSQKLEVDGNISASGDLYLDGIIQADEIKSRTYPSNNILNLEDDNVPNSNGVSLLSVSSMVFGLDTNNNSSTDQFEWRADGTAANNGSLLMTLTDEGNLGIGTSSPTEKLHVDGNISASGDLYINANSNQIFIGDGFSETAGNGKLKIYNSTFDGVITTYQYNSKMDIKAGVSGSGYQNNWSRIRLQDNNSGNGKILFEVSGSEKMRIDNAGNVGIGTSLPVYNLDVYGSTNGIIRAYGPSIGRLSLQNSSRHYSISVQGSTLLVYDEAGGAERMRINSSGDVGIGTTSLSAKLHISQSTSDPGLIVDGGSAGNLIAKFRRSEGISPSEDAYVGIHLADSDAQIRFEPSTETRRWTIGASNADPGNFEFAPAVKISGNEVIYFNREGGIYATSVTASSAISASGGFIGDLTGTASYAENATSSSYATTASYAENATSWDGIFTGSAEITGSLEVIGNTKLGGDVEITGSNNLANNYALKVADSLNNNILVVENDNKVGIGVDNPSYQLDIGGDFNLPLGSNIRFGGQLGIKKVSNGAMHFYAGTNSTTGGFDFATWNGSSYDEETVVIRNNGNVGIGTSSPSYELEVVGDVSASTYYGDGSNLTGINSGSWDGIFSGSAEISGSLQLNNNNVIAKTGTSAANNVAFFSSAETITGDNNLNWTGTVFSIGSTGDTAQFSYADSIVFNGANDDQYFQVKGATDDNLLQVNRQLNDRVGIGTASPEAKLHVADSSTSVTNQPAILAKFENYTDGRNLIRVQNTHTSTGATALATGFSMVALSSNSNQPESNTHEAQLILRSDTANNSGRLQMIAPKDIDFRVDATDTVMTGSAHANVGTAAMFISQSGNVGIGTTTPVHKLDLKTNPAIGFYHSDGTYQGLIGYGSATVTGGGSYDIGFRANSGYNLLFAAGGSTECMRINSSGRVGIGTSSPNYLLDVDGTMFASAGLFGVNGSDRILISNRATNDVAIESFAAELFLSSGYNGISFEGSANTTLMKLTDDGKLGIGTTSPAVTLDVASDNPKIRLTDTDGGIAALEGNLGNLILIADNGNTEASSRIAFKVDGSEHMRIDSSGNVGIGTTSPSRKLTVGSTAALTGNMIALVSTGSSAAYSQIGFGDEDDDNEAQIIYQPYSGKLQLQAGGGGVVSDRGLTLDSSENVGIGTASPSQKLEVNGNIAFSNKANSLIFGSTGADGTWGAPKITRIGTKIIISDYSGVQFGGYDGSAYGARMTVLGTGNVGIGTTSPNAKLDVSGSAIISGSLTVTERITELSTKRFKENIEPLTGSLEKTIQLEGVSFNRIGSDEKEIGFIAEQVAEIYPEFVEYDSSGNEITGIQYSRITAILLESVKELNDKVTSQQIFINDLVARIEKLENK